MSNLLAWASRILIESILAFKKLLKSTGPLRPAMGPTPMHLRDPRSVPVRGPWAVLLGVLSQWILGVLSKYISGVLHLRGPQSVQLRGPPSQGSSSVSATQGSSISGVLGQWRSHSDMQKAPFQPWTAKGVSWAAVHFSPSFSLFLLPPTPFLPF